MNKQIGTESFDDNLFEAFTLLEKGEDNSGVIGTDFIKMLLIQYPSSIMDGVISILDLKEDEIMEFSQF